MMIFLTLQDRIKSPLYKRFSEKKVKNETFKNWIQKLKESKEDQISKILEEYLILCI